MPNPQSRNDRRKEQERSETLIIPHITKEMLEVARSMAERGASRTEIEQAVAAMQKGAPASQFLPSPEKEPVKKPEKSRPAFILTRRPRYSEEQRAAIRAKIERSKDGQTSAEIFDDTIKPKTVWELPPLPKPAPEPTPAQPRTEEERGQDTTMTDLPLGESRAAVSSRRSTASNREAPTVILPPQGENPAQEPAAPLPQQQPPTQPAPAQPVQRRANALPRSRSEAEADLNERIRRDHIWLSNPVLVRGLGLAPVVGAALDGERAFMLCLASLVLVTFTRVLAVAVCHLTQNRFRPVVYCYSAALIYIPTYIMLYELFGADLTVLGIYLPILTVEPAIVKRMEFTDLESVSDALRHGFNNALGMCTALLLAGCLRELLAEGSIFGCTLMKTPILPLAALPAGGFVLVGLLAAVWCAAANLYTDYKREEVRRLYDKHKH